MAAAEVVLNAMNMGEGLKSLWAETVSVLYMQCSFWESWYTAVPKAMGI
jgi:hypothetical protein